VITSPPLLSHNRPVYCFGWQVWPEGGWLPEELPGRAWGRGMVVAEESEGGVGCDDLMPRPPVCTVRGVGGKQKDHTNRGGAQASRLGVSRLWCTHNEYLGWSG